MNRTDRLLAIVLELQGKGHRRAEDLAATFETSKRTIYRDIQALCESGVPVVAVPGQGYSLVEGFFLPPVTFTTDEATMLLLGSDFMAQNFDAQYRAAAQSAGRKIEAVLPQKLRDEVRYLQNSIGFVADSPVDTSKLQHLRHAIVERKTVRFRYHTRYPDSQSSLPAPREADPYGLAHFSGTWYLIAYCHSRRDVRNFRLDRMEEMSLLPKTFVRPANYMLSERQSPSERKLVARVLFDLGVARWVKEAHFFFVTTEEETAEGLLVTLRARQESEILQWLLSWGSKVRVLEPASLQRRLAEEAEGILRNHRR